MRGGSERRGTPSDLLVVGLGNPGSKYERSRHNVGAEAVAKLASDHGATLKAGKERALVAEITLGGERLALAFPTTYMNDSGESVVRLVKRYGIVEPTALVVVHDELDLPPGVVKVKAGGGLAGHNGLRSITQHLKTQDYLRVRIGVGKPPSKEAGAGHVLNRVPASERAILDEAVVVACEAIELIARHGVDRAMLEINGRPVP
ncbi:MAG: aminoacyl-tRNA hydrolase [Ilumatobacteraceae bacterium]